MNRHADENERSIEEISALLYGPTAESLVVAKVEKADKGSRGNEIVAKEVEKKDGSRVSLPLYSPPLPFTQRVLTKSKKKVLSSFKANMSRVGAPLPYVDSLSQVPLHIEFIKAILANREKVEEIMEIFDSPSEQQPSLKTLSKLEDPGRFTIRCSLGVLQLDDALCDLGASVNVMSLEMVKSLGIKDMKQPSSSIMFGDASSKSPLGLIENYPLKVGDCTVPTDFMKVTLRQVNPNTSYPIKPSSTMFCGTINSEDVTTKEEHRDLNNQHQELQVDTIGINETTKLDEDILDGECLDSLFDDLKGDSREGELGQASKVVDKKKRKKKQIHPPTIVSSPMTLCLHPLGLVDGAIEYKVTHKGPSSPFASVKVRLDPKYQYDKDKLHDLLSSVLTINLHSLSTNST
ncbi:PREDICTED: uncharacterized protein LOC104773679 [Camelina sativa]|uniref:Uncharacterized protein LOC104773679 n=1 Tax=Camelina sativa TaxID=90675 RepID=A0ABM0Y785_CAMSA|nr:PREDICTED: uncharacterized protein LOC104773679 [Camelina sativa]